MTARDDYPLVARVEARELQHCDPPAIIRELTFLLDEVDRLRLIAEVADRLIGRN